MDTKKVTDAIALAKTELGNAIQAERKVLADPKADVAAVSAASKSLLVAGRIDGILKSTSARLDKAMKRLEPKKARVKKAPKA